MKFYFEKRVCIRYETNNFYYFFFFYTLKSTRGNRINHVWRYKVRFFFYNVHFFRKILKRFSLRVREDRYQLSIFKRRLNRYIFTIYFFNINSKKRLNRFFNTCVTKSSYLSFQKCPCLFYSGLLETLFVDLSKLVHGHVDGKRSCIISYYFCTYYGLSAPSYIYVGRLSLIMSFAR